MKRVWMIGAGALALSSTLVLAQGSPESLLPPGFDDPAPTPSPTPAPRPTPRPSAAPTGSVSPGSVSSPVVQPIPSGPGVSSAPSTAPSLPSNLPSISELENLDTDELDQLLGLKPKFDIPPAARRSLAEIGVIAPAEGGLPTGSLARQPASLVRAALAGTRGPMVSRWGHILLRRALASRLETPEGMNPVEFATLRAGVLNRMGEHSAARALVQDVDTGNWDKRLTDEGLAAYIGTADIIGACPALQLSGSERDDPQSELWRSICQAFAGQTARANANLRQALSRQSAPEIDVLLAQRYAGAASQGRRAVNIEWDDVDELTPWRFALANALGVEIPDGLRGDAGPYYQRSAATAPMLPLPQRIGGAQRAAREGILSAAAIVDLYSQVYAADGIEGAPAVDAVSLREAYVQNDPAARLAAMRTIWGVEGKPDYGRMVLTAYAAARMPPTEDFREDAATLIASMLAAGLDRDALRWASVLPQGSEGWALLVLVQPNRANPVTEGQLGTFFGNDESAEQRRSQFLVAGLAGLGRIDPQTRDELSGDLEMDLERQTKWSRAIAQAGEVGNSTLVTYLAGLGMQGSSWERMTPRHLYHIVSALNQAGLSAEARMIAAEAVARG